MPIFFSCCFFYWLLVYKNKNLLLLLLLFINNPSPMRIYRCWRCEFSSSSSSWLASCFYVSIRQMRSRQHIWKCLIVNLTPQINWPTCWDSGQWLNWSISSENVIKTKSGSGRLMFDSGGTTDSVGFLSTTYCWLTCGIHLSHVHADAAKV